jgi:hypothetical protein
VVHLAFGVWGILAARSWDAAKTYCRAAGGIYAVLTVLGLVAADALKEIVPLGGNDVWLHAVLALALLFFGFTAKEGSAARATT